MLDRQVSESEVKQINDMLDMVGIGGKLATFKPGDVVCLKSGSPAFTVTDVGSDYVDIIYWDVIPETHRISTCALMHINGGVSFHNRDWYSARNPVAP